MAPATGEQSLTKRRIIYAAVSAGLIAIVSVAALFMLPGFGVKKQTAPLTSEIGDDNDTSYLRLIFAGDIMGHEPQIKAAYDPATKTYAYDSCFRYVRSYIESANFALANLEVTLAGPPYSGYPQFSSPDALARASRDAGFDFLVTANNHSQDRGRKGIERTLFVLDSLNIPHTGTFRDTLSRENLYPHVVSIDGFNLVILNYTYGTNGLKVEAPNVVNMIDTAVIRKDLVKAKTLKPDLVIVTIHWGNEYQDYESKEQVRIARFLATHGADMVIGAHPHVVQPIKYVYSPDSSKRVPVAYSMGNLISNQRSVYDAKSGKYAFKDGGIFVEITVRKVLDKISVTEVNYLPVWVHRAASPASYTLIPVMAFENDTAKFMLNTTEKAEIRRFAKHTRTLLKDVTESGFYRIR